MFRFEKKKLTYLAVFIFFVLFLSSLIPSLRPAILNVSKYPLSLLNLIRREVGGIIFYHRNFVQNEKLQKELDLLRKKLLEREEVSLENKRLKDILSFKQKSSYKVIAARVIGRSADNWSSVVIIDKGRNNGIRRGFVVITYLGLVGRVIETSETTAEVILINDPNIGISGLVQRSRQEGLVSGRLGNSLIMKYLPQDADIKVTDVILTSGLSDIYPKGLLIGRVVDVGEEYSGLSRYAIIKPAVNLSSIEEILVIIP